MLTYIDLFHFYNFHNMHSVYNTLLLEDRKADFLKSKSYVCTKPPHQMNINEDEIIIAIFIRKTVSLW